MAGIFTTNNILNLFYSKSEGKTSLSEDINEQTQDTRNDFISPENLGTTDLEELT